MDAHKRHIFLDGGIIVASMIVASALIAWLIGDLRGSAERISEHQKSIRDAANLMQSIFQIRTAEPQIAALEARMIAILPKEEQLLQFGKWIDELESKHRVSAQHDFRGIAAPASAESPGAAAISLSALGSARDIEAFFSDIESRNGRYIISITSFDISGIRAGQYEASAQGQVFFRK